MKGDCGTMQALVSLRVCFRNLSENPTRGSALLSCKPASISAKRPVPMRSLVAPHGRGAREDARRNGLALGAPPVLK